MTDARKDLLNVPDEDGQKLYGGHDRHVDPASLGDGFTADDRAPGEAFDESQLDFLPGQEFTREDGSKSR